jgi:hypothetical protein
MKLQAYEFSKAIDERIESLTDDAYRLRNTRETKRLFEELLPLSRLAVALKQPGLNVDVEAFEDNREADGLIIVKGFRESELYVQITCDFNYEETLRNELLHTQGHSPSTGPISRNNKTREIEATLISINQNEHIERVAKSVSSLFLKKTEKQYKTKMVLLISCCEVKLKGLNQWSKLLQEINNNKPLNSNVFNGVYLFNECSNEIYRIA